MLSLFQHFLVDTNVKVFRCVAHHCGVIWLYFTSDTVYKCYILSNFQTIIATSLRALACHSVHRDSSWMMIATHARNVMKHVTSVMKGNALNVKIKVWPQSQEIQFVEKMNIQGIVIQHVKRAWVVSCFLFLCFFLFCVHCLVFYCIDSNITLNLKQSGYFHMHRHILKSNFLPKVTFLPLIWNYSTVTELHHQA